MQADVDPEDAMVELEREGAMVHRYQAEGDDYTSAEVYGRLRPEKKSATVAGKLLRSIQPNIYEASGDLANAFSVASLCNLAPTRAIIVFRTREKPRPGEEVMAAIKKKTKKKVATGKKPKSTEARAARTGSARVQQQRKSATKAPSKKVEYIDDFEPVCPIDVGFKSKIRRGNSGVFSVTFPLVESIVEGAGFNEYYGTWRGVYDFEKGLLLSTSSPPDLYRAGAAVFYAHGPRVIDKHDGSKTYWKWHGSLELDDINDEAWALRVENYLNDAQFVEWAEAVIERLGVVARGERERAKTNRTKDETHRVRTRNEVRGQRGRLIPGLAGLIEKPSGAFPMQLDPKPAVRRTFEPGQLPSSGYCRFIRLYIPLVGWQHNLAVCLEIRTGRVMLDEAHDWSEMQVRDWQCVPTQPPYAIDERWAITAAAMRTDPGDPEDDVAIDVGANFAAQQLLDRMAHDIIDRFNAAIYIT